VIRQGHEEFKHSGVVPAKQRYFFVSQGAIMYVRGHWTERMLLAMPFTFNDEDISIRTMMDTKIRIHVGGGEIQEHRSSEGSIRRFFRFGGAIYLHLDPLDVVLQR
jgi:hypothetical protein